MKISVAVFILVCMAKKCTGFEPISTTMVAFTAASSAFLMLGEYVGLTSFRCRWNMVECCDSNYIHPNMTGLKQSLDQNLYGQHLVQKTVYRAVKAHLNDVNPHKPLVMSFHGWTGSGKNYVTRMIIDNIYHKKLRSSFVHVFNAEVDFKHQSQISLYKDQLQSWLRGNVSRCERSIFVFDEMDHMPEGLIDAIKPFLGTETSVNHVDYRKCIFIFLSNTGGNGIVQKCIDLWQEGKSRDTIGLTEVQHLLETSAYNQKSGLKLSGIIDKNLIDHFVPFLPLERDHVRKCIEAEINRIRYEKYISRDILDEIMDELQWFPSDTRLYSKSGCKKIAQKVALVLNHL